MSTARLHCLEAGSKSAPVLVLLHGFGGFAGSWQPVIDRLGDRFYILAFDLPGHGGSLKFPGFGSPRFAALAVIDDLRQHGISSTHIAGHSMGGAIAALMAMEAPDLIASLTLVSPGGFGPEMDQPTLRVFAEAKSAAELAQAMAPMFADGFAPDPNMLAALASIREQPGQREALLHVLSKISRGDGQGVLPLGQLEQRHFAVTLAWGIEDRTVPFSQSANAPDWFNLIALSNAGHMLLDEAPEAVARAILEQLQTV